MQKAEEEERFVCLPDREVIPPRQKKMDAGRTSDRLAVLLCFFFLCAKSSFRIIKQLTEPRNHAKYGSVYVKSYL